MQRKIFLSLAIFCLSNFMAFTMDTVCDPEIKECMINPFSKVDECFTKICKLAENIENLEIKQCVFLELESSRDMFLKDPKSLYRAEILQENMDEVLCEYPDNNLKMEIQNCLSDLVEQLSHEE